MDIPEKRLYLMDITKEKNIKEPKDVLSTLMPYDIKIFASLLNADRVVEINDSNKGLKVPRSMLVQIREEYLQEVIHQGNWTGTLMEANITIGHDNPYFTEESVHTMYVGADDSLSLSIEDLFVYEHDLAALEAQYPDIFVPIINTEIIEQQSISPNQKLTDLDEISCKIKNKMLTVTLRSKESQYIKALLARLERKSFKECYFEVNPKTRSREPETLLDQGKRYCKEAHKIVKEKMNIDFDFDIIKGRMD